MGINQLGSKWPKVERIPSGSLSLDAALGGGWPRGRFAEIYGPQSGGKTFLTLLAIAEAQKLGGRAAFFDVEHSFDPEWAKKLGVDVDKLYFTQPDYGEQALESIKILAETNEFDIIVLDSIAELLPKAEIEQPMEKMNIGLQARMLGQCLRKLGPAIGKSKATALFINQTRSSMSQWGDGLTTPGGNAFKFYASLRVQVSRVSKSDRIDDQSPTKDVIGHDLSAYTVKNKTFPPFRTAVVPIKYLSGVIPIDDFINAITAKGMFTWAGGVRYQGKSVESIRETRWASWDKFKEWVVVDGPEVAELRKEIRES